MRFDITRLPVGEMLVGFVLSAVVVTFILAAWVWPSEGGIEDETAAAGPTPTAAPATPGAGARAEIKMISTIKFDKEDISVPAGEQVTVTVTNEDDAIPHNWALYTDESAKEKIAGTEGCPDCTETVTVEALEAGVYFFRCDFHPQQMVGTYTVQ